MYCAAGLTHKHKRQLALLKYSIVSPSTIIKRSEMFLYVFRISVSAVMLTKCAYGVVIVCGVWLYTAHPLRMEWHLNFGKSQFFFGKDPGL